MNIYICGQKHFAAEIFTALQAAGHAIVGVSSPEFNQDGASPDRLKAVIATVEPSMKKFNADAQAAAMAVQ